MFQNSYELEQRSSSFMAGVYGWMSVALAITAGTAYYLGMSPQFVVYLYTHSGMLWGLMLAQLAIVFAISLFINRMSFMTALVLFLVYAVSLGITLSSIFFVYSQSSILSTFLTAAGMFGCMSVYGYFTKADLTGVGNIAFMVLIGLCLAMFINMFLGSEQFDYIVSGIGVVLFVILTAYDTQRIKQIGRSLLADHEMVAKITLIGALTLYLDFINIFLFLLRFMGNRRN